MPVRRTPTKRRRDPHPFAAYLRALQQQHSTTVKEFAERLGVDPTHLSRAMGNGQPFDAHGCFKLAKETGEPPERVLRAAGKAQLADWIAQFYGASKPQPKPAPLPPRLREVIEDWKSIDKRGDEDDLLDAIWKLLRRSRRNHDIRRRQHHAEGDGDGHRRDGNNRREGADRRVKEA